MRFIVIAMVLVLAACGATKEEQKAAGLAMARGLKAQSDVYDNRAAQQRPVTTTRRPNYAGGMVCQSY